MTKNPVVHTHTLKTLMSPAAREILDISHRLVRMIILSAIGLGLMCVGVLMSGSIYWNITELSIPVTALGATLSIAGILGWLTHNRAYNHMVTVVDVYETTESAVEPEGTIHATLAPSPVSPNRLVGGPVRLRTDQWQMIYDASQAAGWQFSRPLIEKAIKKTGVTITNLNAVYTKLYRWLEDMQLIVNTKPGAKNPAYRLTPKGRYVVESYTNGVDIQNDGGRLRFDTSEVQ